MNPFDSVIDEIIKKEKGYVNLSTDRGGPTNYGITQAVARANGYQGDMRDLPESLARSIYLNRYIIIPQFDKIYTVSNSIGMELIDTGVNMGPGVGATLLQRWLNGFNYDGSHYSDVFPDGRIGPVTVSALKAFLTWRGKVGEVTMLKGLNGSQAVRYLDIAEGDKTQRANLFGWVSNRVS